MRWIATGLMNGVKDVYMDGSIDIAFRIATEHSHHEAHADLVHFDSTLHNINIIDDPLGKMEASEF